MTKEESGVKKFLADIAGERADAGAARLSGNTRANISRLFDEGRVLINGKPAKKSARLKERDEIEIDFPEEKPLFLEPKNIPLDIVIDKENYAIINKPAGLTVHPAPGHWDDTLVHALLYAFSIKDEDNGFRPGIVHRLDKDTSGLLAVAKNSRTRAALSQLFGRRLVDKKYLAICQGKPRFAEKTVEAPIGRDPRNRKRMTAGLQGGREASSFFKVLEEFKEGFLAEVAIFTGRTHQIRAHASFIGHPLIGDVLYGGKKLYGFPRQALHSAQIRFLDPFTGEEIRAASQMPEDMLLLTEILRSKGK